MIVASDVQVKDRGLLTLLFLEGRGGSGD